jgi:hypothetical protein
VWLEALSPYDFEWSNGAVTQNLVSVSAGSYTLTVIDGNSCTATENGLVGQLSQMSATVSKIDVTVCLGNANGEIHFTNPQGGSGNYNYSVDGASSFQASPNFTGLTAGNYNTFIKDVNAASCEVSLGTINVADQPDLPAPIFPGGNSYSSCGLIVVNATPGAGANQVRLYNGHPSLNNVVSTGTSFVLRNLPAGTYTFYGTSFESSINCEGDAFTTFTLEVISPLLLSGTSTEVSCFGLQDGEVDLIATGATTPYNYAWSNGSNTEDLVNLNGGVYTVTVTDPNGCFNIETFNVTEYSPLNAELDILSINGFNVRTCATPTSLVQVNVTGGKKMY